MFLRSLGLDNEKTVENPFRNCVRNSSLRAHKEKGRQVEQAEATLLELDERLNEIAEKAVHDDAALNEVRQGIAEQVSKWRLHQTRGREVEEQVTPLRRQLIQQRLRLR